MVVLGLIENEFSNSVLDGERAFATHLRYMPAFKEALMLNYNCYIYPGEGKWQKGEKEKGLMEMEKSDFLLHTAFILNLKFLIHYEPVSSSSRETNFISLNKYLELTGSQQAGFIDWCRGEEW